MNQNIMNSNTTNRRPLVDLRDGKVTYEGAVARVIMCKEKISINCTDITPAALYMLAKAYDGAFPDDNRIVVIQDEGYRK